MTLAMPDSTIVANLPDGYPAYLGYADGRYNTAAELAKRFPAAELVLLTVSGQMIDAHGSRVSAGADDELFDLNARDAVGWAWGQLERVPGRLPVIYASVIGLPGYGMGDVIKAMSAIGMKRSQAKLLSAHYGDGPHICGPATCRLIDVPMDGTQWTTMFKGLNGSDVDMSILADDFFGPPQSETERLVRELGIVKRGDKGAMVWTVQGLCHARRPGAGPLMDGIYGPETMRVVEQLQAAAKLTVDGVVGPLTWPVLLGVA
jgi:peptidoglycan hydrolase-like protein with peptidoglycan-binding domain